MAAVVRTQKYIQHQRYARRGQVGSPRWSFEGQECVHCAHGNEYKFEGDLRRLKERFEGLRKGICLDCVRTDCNSLGEG